MSYSNIRFEVGDAGIALLTVNRPEKLNALNTETVLELHDAAARAGSDREVRALIVTGAGEKAFVAGADINQLAVLTPIEAQAYAERGQRVFREIEMLAKPTLAAINGYALGGGLELAMSCAVRVASENARLGQPEVKLGILPGYGGTQRLPRLVGRGRALEMLLSGEPVTAAEAYRIGLVNHVVPQAELLEFSRQWLRKVLANAPLALGLTLQAVDVGLEAGLEQGLRFEAAAFGLTTATEDKREGTRAFLEKRPAAFAGKLNMPKVIEGQLTAAGLKFAIVVSRFNGFISERLLGGALDALARTGGQPDDIEVVKVPGSWELPVVVRELARQKRHDAIICLGAVIRGDTPHFDYVAGEAVKGIGHVAAESGVPVSFGVLTCNTLEQAIDRAGAKSGNKGFDAAMAAIEMANLMRQLRQAN